MPKSKVIKAIVDDEVSLAQSLTRLQVIAHDLKNKELETWAENELVGYASEDDAPEYRHAKSINYTEIILSECTGGNKESTAQILPVARRGIWVP